MEGTESLSKEISYYLNVQPKLPNKYNTFCDLDTQRAHADALFLSHQIALLHRQWEAAMAALEKVVVLRRHNIMATETYLLPLYMESKVEKPSGGDVEYFKREHRLIEKRLNGYIRLMGRKTLHPDRIQLDMVRLFDEYRSLKDLFDHHDARKRHIMYPFLDTNVDNRNQAAILQQIVLEQAKRLEEVF